MFFNFYIFLLFLSFNFMILSLYFFMNVKIILINVSWMKLNLLDLDLFFFFDWMSLIFISVVMLISSMTFYYSSFYMSSDSKLQQLLFVILTLMFILSMLLVIISLNMLIIMLGWDGLGLISYCLVIYYQNEISNYSGLVTLLTNRLGDIGLILSMFFMMNFYDLNLINFNISNNMNNLFLFLLILGAFTKSAQFPFSAWLPLAMAAPTPISALVHSSTLVTVGIYLIMRLNMIFKNNFNLSLNFFFVSVLTMFFSGCCALGEMDLKKIIALSTLSQLGLMMMILLSGFELMAFYHLLTHAMFKALLFLCSGIMIHEYFNMQDIRGYGMIYKKNILISSIFFFSSLTLMGFPFLSGFYSKDLILEMIYMSNYSIFVFFSVILSTIFTCLYSLRLMMISVWNLKNKNMFLEYEVWNKIHNPIIFMFLIILFWGCVLSWLFSSQLDYIYIFNFSKIINLNIIFFSLVFFYFFSLNLKFSFLKMWFLGLMQDYFSKKILILSKKFFKMDNFWIEEVLTKNFIYYMMIFSKKINFNKFLNFKILMKIFFILLLYNLEFKFN